MQLLAGLRQRSPSRTLPARTAEWICVLEEVDACGMNFPKGRYLSGPTLLRMLKIFEWQAEDTDWNGSDEVTAMTHVQLKPELL
jgi:hypothetical protein